MMNFAVFLRAPVLGNHDYRGDVLAQLDPALVARDARWHCERAFVLRYLLAGQFLLWASLVNMSVCGVVV
jgi:hypothetical protein